MSAPNIWDLVQVQVLVPGESGQVLRLFIFTRLPGEVDAAGPWTIV